MSVICVAAKDQPRQVSQISDRRDVCDLVEREVEVRQRAKSLQTGDASDLVAAEVQSTRPTRFMTGATSVIPEPVSLR